MEKKIIYYIDKVESLIAGNPEMPVTVEIDPSNRCQLDCEYCMFKVLREKRVDMKGEVERPDLPFDLYRHLLLDLKMIGVRSITFTGGGEPLLHPRFNDMACLAYQNGFEIGLITNGVNLHSVERLDRFKFVRVSLDAGSREVFQQLKRADSFNRVIENLHNARKVCKVLGISYVVNQTNKSDIQRAQTIARQLEVDYIQFKPAWVNGEPFLDYSLDGNSPQTIDTKRYKAVDKIPCAIAGLIGIIGADSHIYYCCQYRGDRRYGLGSLFHAPFPNIWKRRPQLIPDIQRCPNCRYMNYTRAYKTMVQGNSLFFEHRHFL